MDILLLYKWPKGLMPVGIAEQYTAWAIMLCEKVYPHNYSSFDTIIQTNYYVFTFLMSTVIDG